MIPESRRRSTGPSTWTPTCSRSRSPPCRPSPCRRRSRSARPGAVDEREQVEAPSPVRDREAEVRRAAVDDCLVVADERGVLAVDVPFGLGHAGSSRTPRQPLVEGGRSRARPPVKSNGGLPEMTAFEPLRMSVKILSNAWSIESVRTYVPLIIATPRTIASAVSAVRSLRRRPRSAKRVMRRAYS